MPPKQGKLDIFFAKKGEQSNDPAPVTARAKRKRRIIESSEEENDTENVRVKKKLVKLEKEKVVKEEERKTPLKTEKVSKKDFAEDLPTNSEDVDTEEITKKEEGTINAVAVLLASNNISANIDIDWKAGESVPYAALVNAYEKIEATSKRLEIQEIMTTFFLRILEKSPDSLLEVIYLCINRICPEFEGLELGIGEASLMKAIAMSTGRKVQAIRKEYSETGDLGLVAKASKKAQSTLFTPKPMTVSSVFKAFRKIALTSGADSIERKVQSIAALMSSCRSGEEAKYLIRSLEGKLRIGLAEATVLISLAQATVMNNSEYKTMSKNDKTAKLAEAPNVLKAVYSELPSYDIIVPVLLKHGVDGLREHCKLTPGIPCKPMLAHPTKSITEVLDRVEGHKFTCEYKYDGERGQIHLLEDGTIKIFSRNLEDNSQKFPDIIKNVARFIKEGTKSFVLDCEVVAWDKEKKSILPFQVLTTRKRKDVKHEDIKVTVCVFGFDILYYNGEPLLQKSLETRRDILFSVFNEVEGEFAFVCYKNLTQVEDIQTFLDESVKGSCEGLMIKILDGTESSYEPSKRSRNWLKLKKDYLSGVGDSLDLVVIGAYYGRGKRTGVYGGFLLACYDPDTEQYQTITKTSTGLSDQNLEDFYKHFSGHVIDGPKRYYNFDEKTKPDVWFEPNVVWEVLAADLSISPVYKAAVGTCDPSKGISLRFPRFIRIREDKKPEDATTSDMVAEMYQRQFKNNES